jgi:hypothetical protein
MKLPTTRTQTQTKIQRLSYNDLQRKLKRLYKELKLSTTKEETNYFEMEILVTEEYLAHILSKGQR